MREQITHSPSETIALGREVGASLDPSSVLCFYGDLGAGKTTFIKGVVEGVTKSPEVEVNSPTFVYLNIYQGDQPVYHFDLYRLHDQEEFLAMGFDEFFDANGVTCLEWSERIPQMIPSDAITVKIEHLTEKTRKISIS